MKSVCFCILSSVAITAASFWALSTMEQPQAKEPNFKPVQFASAAELASK